MTKWIALNPDGTIDAIYLIQPADDEAPRFIEGPDEVLEGWKFQSGSWAAPPAPPPIVPGMISRRQMLIGLALDGMITDAEALAASTTGALPALLAQVVATQSPADQLTTKIGWATALDFRRDDPVLAAAAAIAGKSSQDLDAFFITYGAI